MKYLQILAIHIVCIYNGILMKDTLFQGFSEMNKRESLFSDKDINHTSLKVNTFDGNLLKYFFHTFSGNFH